MPSKINKYFLIVILICISWGTYWFFFKPHWGVALKNEHLWEYAFSSKENSSFDIETFSTSKEKIAVSEENKLKNLIFHAGFNIEDCNNILEEILEYEYRYFAKILINGTEFSDVARNKISSTLEDGRLKVDEYWRPRKIKLSQEFLSKHLKNGENTITMIVYNVDEFESIDCSKKQLSFLTKGRNNNFKHDFKIQKPSSYFHESTLPIFKINTHDSVIPDEPKLKASLSVINNDVGVNNLSDLADNYNIKIERRGHTSQTFAKKSYSFNVYDSVYKKTAVPLLNLPPSKKWVLYGPFADKSLIRNALTYSIYTQMGNYAPRTQFIDLVINDNYRGIYMLTEKIQIGQDHLNINPLKIDKKDSLKANGGYLLEIDRNNWKAPFPPKSDTSSHALFYDIYAPKKNKLNPYIEEKIKSQYYSFEKHLYEEDSIYKHLDINSFIDYLIITEVTKNIDGYCLSTFLYNKNINDNTPKFYIGPIWDYNFSFGLTDYREGFNPEGYVYNSTKFIPFWWKKLLSNEVFEGQLKSRYFELRKTTLSNQNINATIDSLANICSASAEFNFNKWTVLNSTEFWPNYFLGKTYDDEINYLKKWTKERFYFLDNDILAKEKRDVKYYEISIRTNPDWMQKIKEKATKRGVSIDEMIQLDAKHMSKK